MTKVFISHAATDKQIADQLAELLTLGLNIKGDEIFCSSLPGRNIEPGFNFVDYIKGALSEAKVVLLLMTENYLASQFCLAEVGASWISKEAGSTIPLIVPPIGFSRLNATLAITHALNIKDSVALSEMADSIDKKLETRISMAQWEHERDKFLKRVIPLIDAQESPIVISPEEHEKVTQKLAYVEEKNGQLERQLIEAQSQIDELKQLKDKEAVMAFELEHMEEPKQLEKLIEAAGEALNDLPRIVQEAMFYSLQDKELPHPKRGDVDGWEKVNNAIDKKMLLGAEGQAIILNDGHPLVRKQMKPIELLQDFIDGLSSDFCQRYAEQHGYYLSLGDKSFWEKVVSGNSNRYRY
jgi:hypothetical protein